MNMKLHFLGTGAADWNGPDERGEHRRLSSMLLNDHVLIDFTADKLDVFSGHVDAVLITHSHDDHYDPEAIKMLSPDVVYVHASWADAAKSAGLPAVGVQFGEWVEIGEVRAMPVPTNHLTARPGEQTCGWLLEESSKRCLYMTDTSWIPPQASRLIGPEPLDALIIDSTIGPNCPRDWRIFEHTSVAMAKMIVESMSETGRLRREAPVFCQHMARTLWPAQKEAEEMLDRPFVVCFDGMTAEI